MSSSDSLRPAVAISEKQVADVVAEISRGAGDPQHLQATVGAFMRRQPTVGHYVSAHAQELGMEGVVLTLLHASVIARAIELASGRRLRPAKASDLDQASSAAGAELGREQPALADYLRANVSADDSTLGGKRHLVALELLGIITRAFLSQH